MMTKDSAIAGNRLSRLAITARGVAKCGWGKKAGAAKCYHRHGEKKQDVVNSSARFT